MVVGEPRQLAAEVRDVGSVGGGRPAPQRVEQRPIADHRARHPLDPGLAELADELAGSRAVALLPVAVEPAVAQGRVAAALQVQVAVPVATRTEVARAEHRGGQPGAPSEL